MEVAIEERDWEQACHEVARLARRSGPWLDSHMIAGNPENRLIAHRIYRLLLSVADFEQIVIGEHEKGGLYEMLHKATFRLRKVIQA